MKNKALVIIPIILFVIIVIVLSISYFLQSKSNSGENLVGNTDTNSNLNQNINNDQKDSSNSLIWSFNGTNWVNTDAKPSNCPNTLVLQAPVDLNKVTSIMYPGQKRGGNYKAHGGFRLDKSSNNIEVKMPIDAYLYSASSYIESGERQYMVDFMSNCGYLVKFDHLLKLTPELAAIFKAEIPDNGVNDSRTTKFKTFKEFKAGELIATEIGFKSPKNVGVDFGVYDLNRTNDISKDSKWNNEHKMFAEKTFYGICWLDYLNSEDMKKVYSLKEIGVEGNESDYCN